MVRWGSAVQIRSGACSTREVRGNAKKNTPVEKIALQCTECKQKNYTTQKNRRNTTGKLELMKYCPFERKHTLHRETKIK